MALAAKKDDLLAAGAAAVIATDQADVAEAVRRHTAGPAPTSSLTLSAAQASPISWLRPAIDKVFPTDDIVEAHRYLEKGAYAGKIVVRVS